MGCGDTFGVEVLTFPYIKHTADSTCPGAEVRVLIHSLWGFPRWTLLSRRSLSIWPTTRSNLGECTIGNDDGNIRTSVPRHDYLEKSAARRKLGQGLILPMYFPISPSKRAARMLTPPNAEMNQSSLTNEDPVIGLTDRYIVHPLVCCSIGNLPSSHNHVGCDLASSGSRKLGNFAQKGSDRELDRCFDHIGVGNV